GAVVDAEVQLVVGQTQPDRPWLHAVFAHVDAIEAGFEGVLAVVGQHFTDWAGRLLKADALATDEHAVQEEGPSLLIAAPIAGPECKVALGHFTGADQFVSARGAAIKESHSGAEGKQRAHR